MNSASHSQRDDDLFPNLATLVVAQIFALWARPDVVPLWLAYIFAGASAAVWIYYFRRIELQALRKSDELDRKIATETEALTLRIIVVGVICFGQLVKVQQFEFNTSYAPLLIAAIALLSQRIVRRRYS